jgi:hypothetical protein
MEFGVVISFDSSRRVGYASVMRGGIDSPLTGAQVGFHWSDGVVVLGMPKGSPYFTSVRYGRRPSSPNRSPAT